MSFEPYTTEEIAERRGKVDGTNFDRKLVDVDGKKYEVKEKDVSDDANVPDTRPYKVYTALLTQAGTSAPTAIVLENTLGAVGFTRDDFGAYNITSAALFAANKTSIVIGSNGAFVDDATYINTSWADSSTFSFYTLNSSNTASDGILLQTLIEIRVYN